MKNDETKKTTRTNERSRLRVPWKLNMSLAMLGAPSLRRIFGRFALKYLYTQVLVDPKTMAYVLLTRLRLNNDPVLVWHTFNLLLRVPEVVLEDEWLRRVVTCLDDIPGRTFRERISVCERVLTRSFDLWDAVSDAAKVPIDYEGLDARIRRHECKRADRQSSEPEGIGP